MKYLFRAHDRGSRLYQGQRGTILPVPDHLVRPQVPYPVLDSLDGVGPAWSPPEPAPASLEDARQGALAILKDARQEALGSGFAFAGKRFQTRHQMDVLNITNVGIASMVDPAFQTAFRAEDNSWLPLDAAAAQAFYRTMVARGAQIWAAYGEREAAILAAQSLDELATLNTHHL